MLNTMLDMWWKFEKVLRLKQANEHIPKKLEIEKVRHTLWNSSSIVDSSMPWLLILTNPWLLKLATSCPAYSERCFEFPRRNNSWSRVGTCILNEASQQYTCEWTNVIWGRYFDRSLSDLIACSECMSNGSFFNHHHAPDLGFLERTSQADIMLLRLFICFTSWQFDPPFLMRA
jgi:hypothetical protein